MLFGLFTTQKEKDEAAYKADESALAQVDYWLERGKIVEAIKAWRQHSGLGLKESKAAVDSRYDELFPYHRPGDLINAHSPATIGELIQKQLADH
jgi:hypothetical protein